MGRPTIVRHNDLEIGKVRTIVQVDSGELRVFGESTVKSLADSADADAQCFVGELSERELHGLVHEIGQRLLANSREYQNIQAHLEQLCDSANYEYFGLSPTATE